MFSTYAHCSPDVHEWSLHTFVVHTFRMFPLVHGLGAVKNNIFLKEIFTEYNIANIPSLKTKCNPIFTLTDHSLSASVRIRTVF